MDRSSTHNASSRQGKRAITFDERLLAETVRAAEDLAGGAAGDEDAVQQAQRADGDLEQRIVTRAKALPNATALESSLRHVRSGMTLLIVFAMVLALAAGVGAARAALGGQRHEPVIFLPVLGGLLGVQTLLLLAWALLVLVQPRSLSGASLGGLVFRAAEFLARIGSRSREHMAAIQATAEVTLNRSIARWKFSAISHGLWTAFNIGCIAMLLLLLSAKRYTFAWETTILSPGAYEPMVNAIAWLPKQVGFETPSAAQIAASQWTGEGDPPEESRHAWSGLLIGSMVVYGVLPRIVLLIVSMTALAAARRRYRMDPSKPGFARLQSKLMPSATSLGVVDRDDAGPAQIGDGAPAHAAHHEPATGPPAIIGLEIDRPRSGWPPAPPGASFTDHGLIDDRQQRHSAIERLQSQTPRPRTVVIVCALTATPDRGIATFIEQVRESARVPVVLVLTAGQTLRQRGSTEQLKSRIEDWRRLARSVGIESERIVELDLDHATDASLESLSGLLGTGATSSAGHARKLEAAFDAIIEHVSSWPAQPTLDQRLALHKAIGHVYRGSGGTWFDRAKSLTGSGAKLAEQVRVQARWSVMTLPGRLRNTPKWAVAGASAGALGCLAVATFAAPAALAVLPSWSLVGGAITSALHAAHQLAPEQSEPAGADTTEQTDRAEAVRAATLFAVLLELQGRSEAAISSALDATFNEDDDPPVEAAHLRPWLDEVRHRFDLAVTQLDSGGLPT